MLSWAGGDTAGDDIGGKLSFVLRISTGREKQETVSVQHVFQCKADCSSLSFRSASILS